MKNFEMRVRNLDIGRRYGENRRMAKMGRKPSNKPKRRCSTIYFDDTLLKRLKMYGVLVDKDISDIVHTAVTEYLDKKKAPEVPSEYSNT